MLQQTTETVSGPNMLQQTTETVSGLTKIEFKIPNNKNTRALLPLQIYKGTAAFADTQTKSCTAYCSSVSKLGQHSLLSFHKLCHCQACVMMVTEDAPMKMTSTFWAVYKPLPQTHGTGFFVVPLALPAHSTGTTT